MNFSTFEDRDEYGRKRIALNLKRVLAVDIGFSPIALDGPWGSGKTEFCIKLMNEINGSEDSLNCVYIDCFKYDHTDDPLLMLIAKIGAITGEDKEIKEILKASAPLLKAISKIGLNAGAHWLLRTNSEELQEDVAKALAESKNELFELGVENAFKQIQELEKNIDTLRELLGGLVKDRKVVIIIDELDRCKPSFALSLLEKVKHIFDIENVDFVFATYLPQLRAMVEKQYGDKIKAEKYLDKFFNFTIDMPDSHLKVRGHYEQNSYNNFRVNLVNKEEDFFKLSKDDTIEELISHLFEKDKISLRESETFFRNLKIYNLLSNKNLSDNPAWLDLGISIFGVYIYTFHSHFCSKINSRTYSDMDLKELFGYKPSNLMTSPEKSSFSITIFGMMLFDSKLISPIASGVSPKKEVDWNDYLSQLFMKHYHGRRWGEKGSRISTLQDTIRTMQFIQ